MPVKSSLFGYMRRCILMPCDIAGAFFGFSGGNLKSVMSELEGTMVDLAASTKDLTQQYDEDDVEVPNAAPAAAGRLDGPRVAPVTPVVATGKARPSKGARKRMKHEAHIRHVRERQKLQSKA